VRRTTSSRRRRRCPCAPARGASGVVERVEVVVTVSTSGPSDGEAEAEEDVLELAPGGVSRCRRRRLGRVAGQRDVDAVLRRRASSSCAGELARRARSISASRAPGGPGWRPCRRPALLGLELGDAAQQVAAARPCGRGSASAAPRARRCGRGGDRRLGLARSCRDPLDHERPHARGHPSHLIQRHGGGHRGVQRVAGSWDVRHVARSARRPPGRPSRSAPTSSVTAPSGRTAQRLARAARTSATIRSRQLGDRARRARPSTAKIAPMLARTPWGRGGRRSRDPSATHEAPKACAARSTCRRCPDRRRPTAHAQRSGRRAPALLVDADHARAGAERRRRRGAAPARRREARLVRGARGRRAQP
jgi:hypothetical protein